MMKNKKILEIALSSLMAVACIFAVTVKGGNVAVAGGECSHHVGNHYTEKAATLLEGGASEYYVCCNCHNVILASEHKEGDGTWTDKGVAGSVDKSHRAFIEPTVTKAQVEEKLALLDNSVSIGSVTGGVDQLYCNVARQYTDAYLQKSNTAETDLSGIEYLHGVENMLQFKNSTSLGIEFNSDNTLYRGGCSIDFNQTDETIGLNYHRINNPSGISGYDWLFYVKLSALNNLPDGSLQIYVRPEIECTLLSQVNAKSGNIGGAETLCAAGKWTAIVFTPTQVAAIKDLGGSSYSGNGVRVQIRYSSLSGNVDFTSWYGCTGKNLFSYNLLSNENYSYGNVYEKGGVSSSMNYKLQSSNPWFKGLPKAENNTKSYRDNFIETYYENKTGVDKTCDDFTWDSPSWFGNGVYSCLFFNPGSEFKKTVEEMFFMVYSNIETDIHMSKLFNVCKKSDAKQTAVTNTKLYKGWNMINIAIPEGGLAFDYSSGTFFTLVPSLWKTGAQIILTGLFYRAAE